MTGGYLGQYREPPEPVDISDALGELRLEFEASAVGIALQALQDAIKATSDKRSSYEAAQQRNRAYVRAMRIEERAAERLLDRLPDLADFTAELVDNQYDIQCDEESRLSA